MKACLYASLTLLCGCTLTLPDSLPAPVPPSPAPSAPVAVVSTPQSTPFKRPATPVPTSTPTERPLPSPYPSLDCVSAGQTAYQQYFIDHAPAGSTPGSTAQSYYEEGADRAKYRAEGNCFNENQRREDAYMSSLLNPVGIYPSPTATLVPQ